MTLALDDVPDPYGCDPYGEGSWDVYDEWWEAHANDPYYLPTPDEIRTRAQQVRWLVMLGFSNALMNSVMIEQCPDIRVVVALVDRGHSPDAIERMLRPQLEGWRAEQEADSLERTRLRAARLVAHP